MLLKDLIEVMNEDDLVKIDTPTRWVVKEPAPIRDAKEDMSNYMKHKVEHIHICKNWDMTYLRITLEEYNEEQKRDIWWNS